MQFYEWRWELLESKNEFGPDEVDGASSFVYMNMASLPFYLVGRGGKAFGTSLTCVLICVAVVTCQKRHLNIKYDCMGRYEFLSVRM